MNKIVYVAISILILMGLLYFVNSSSVNQVEAAQQNVSLSTTVQEYLSFSITAGGTVAFGNLTPGTPICYNTGTVASVTTNAANGYTIGLSDSVAGTNSALLHTDTTTRIADYAGTIDTPTSWTGTGLGVGLYAADTNKESKWGTGTTVCDANNKYAGIPQNTTTAHTASGYKSGADTSSWSFKVDVPNTQKTGSYSGTVTFTATAVLS